MLVINPFSGKGVSKAAIGNMVSQLCNGGYAVTVYFVGEHTPDQIASLFAGQHELAICVGGDGTLNGFVTGLLQSGIEIPIGFVPLGTANDVARTHAMPKKHAAAISKIMAGTTRPLDVGRFSDRYFTYVAAFGAFTKIAYTTSRRAKRVLGHLAYILSGVGSVAAIKARRTVIEHDAGVIEGEFVFCGVLNSTSVAGFVKLDPGRVDLADGLFELLLVRRPIKLSDFLDIMAGVVKKTYDGDGVQLLHTSNVKFTFEEDVAWTIDGEDGGLHREVEISNCHRAIDVIL